MASRVSNKEQLDNCKAFIQVDRSTSALDFLIKRALIQADRELHNCDSLMPLAWDVAVFDNFPLTRYGATISAVTAADPGVITAASVDSSVTGHGFPNHTTIGSLIVLDSIAGMTELNRRVFLMQYASATTLTLKTIDGLDAVDTSGYDTYTSGGTIYHAGYVLNTTTILANVDSQWTFDKIVERPELDGFPLDPISEREIQGCDEYTFGGGGRPSRYRYWKNYTNFQDPDIAHYLFWYPPCNAEYTLKVPYRKEIPDITGWSTSDYVSHPAEVQDAVWQGALAILAGNSKKVDQSGDKDFEVMYAQKWVNAWEDKKRQTKKLSRRLHALQTTSGDMRG